MTSTRFFWRRGPFALLLAVAAGASAPLAAGVPLLLVLPAKPEVRRMMLACPGPAEHSAAKRPGPWLARCGVVRSP